MSDLQAPLRPKRKWALVDFFVQFRWIVVIFVVSPHFLLYLLSDHESHGLLLEMRNVDYKRARHFEVDLSAFRNVLEIDTQRKIARVEPLVNMGQITRVTCPLNLALAVVAEFDDLTVGGLINGYGIEGSSHIFGLFSDTVVAYEIVLANGQLVRATQDNEYSDLFYAIPWSQGTLGLLVAAEIKLIDIKEYMRLTYKPVVGNLQEIAQAYSDSFAPRFGGLDEPGAIPGTVPEFVETMIYTPTEAVCMTGRYASKEEAKKKGNVINEVGWWFKPWFYQHAQKALKKGEFVEYIPTRQYYHRHTRSIYWEGKLILPFADQFWFRFLLGWMMPPKISLLKATQGEAIRNYYHDMHVIQDMLVPLYKVGDALEWVHHEMEVYPIWLCPHRLYKSPVKSMIYAEPGFEHQRRQGDTPYSRCTQMMENWLIENHGFQPQYAVSELSEKKFWTMFEAGHYEHCRRKYGAVGTFMSVYYKSKKGRRKTEKEVQEAEQAIVEAPIAEVDEPVDY
ncbi:hypothetical protein M0R45_022811 [Rubus argutus]|uniref:Delta(24)-sterol reductase n=1 Tax=Rubus argutus TaxID=59490 RepID=A0AAW1XFR3_RUBAR